MSIIQPYNRLTLYYTTPYNPVSAIIKQKNTPVVNTRDLSYANGMSGVCFRINPAGHQLKLISWLVQFSRDSGLYKRIQSADSCILP